MQIRAFTLIELIVSVFLLAILFSLGLGGYIYQSRSKTSSLGGEFLKNIDKNTKEIVVYGNSCQKCIIIDNDNNQELY